MASESLERTVDKILDHTQKRMVSALGEALDESQKRLADALPGLEAEYDRIISDGRKEADKIEKHIIGSSDLEARNKHLLTVEEAVDRVFKEALGRISRTSRDGSYLKLTKTILGEVSATLGSADIILQTNDADRQAVGLILEDFPGMTLSEERIQCMGGVIARSGDGAMTFDNTLDARISRLKPLIRKEIARKFGVVG